MKASDVMKEHVKWLKDRCKVIQKEIDSNQPRSAWDLDYHLERLKIKLEECIAIKIATEKYMKKLRHEGN